MIWNLVRDALWPPKPGTIYDRRDTASREHTGPTRPWSRITGICLHQTACVLGEKPERWDSVGAHIGITRAGRVMWLHDFDRLVWHGNGWNAQTVGIEIDGLFAGLDGVPATVWGDGKASKVTDAQITAAHQVIRWVHSEVVQHGGELTALVAHRQSSKSRRSDPGEAIWRHVALPMHAELGLSDGGAGFEIGGYAVPEAWDPRCKGVRY